MNVDTILAAAASIPSEQRFGRFKVYVSDLHMVAAPGMSLDAFKALLVQLHRSGKIEMSRVDMTTDQKKTDASEIRYECATWHVVRVA